MWGRRLGTVLAVVTCAAGLTVGGATGAAADESDCGFSLWDQTYKNCHPGTEVILIQYQMWGPGAWMYPKEKWCIRPYEKVSVARPDGLIAGGGTPLPMLWCDADTMANDHPAPPLWPN